MPADLFFTLDYDNNVETYATAAEARAAADAIIESALDEEWPDDMESVCWGEIRGRAEEYDRHDHEDYGHTASGHAEAVDDDTECPVPSDHDWTCNYRLKDVAGDHATIAASVALGPDASADDVVREIAALDRRAEVAESDANAERERAKEARAELALANDSCRDYAAEVAELRAEIAAYRGRPEGALPGWRTHFPESPYARYERDWFALIERYSDGHFGWYLSSDAHGSEHGTGCATPRAAMRAAEAAARARGLLGEVTP